MTNDRRIFTLCGAIRASFFVIFIAGAISSIQACVTTQGSKPAAAQEPKSEAAEPVNPEDLEIIEVAKRIEKEVEELRGLKFKRSVKKGVYDKERLAKLLKKAAEEENLSEQFAWQQSAYKIFGLIPESMDMMKEMEEVLMEQIGGFYDPKTQELRVMRGFKGAIGDILMAHELCHALDDQYYDLQNVDDTNKKLAPDNDDRNFAAHAVMEGCATDLMNRFAMQQMMNGKMSAKDMMSEEMLSNPAFSGKRAAAAPPIIVTPLMEMYMSGASFLARGKGTMGMGQTDPEDVEFAFLNPPLSSEQVLHPKKYWDKKSRDLPMDITIPDLAPALGDGWKKLGSNVLGEIGVAILTLPPEKDDEPTDEKNPLADAMKMINRKKTSKESKGWDGDRFEIYQNKDGVQLLVWASVWDTPGDAKEMHDWLVANIQDKAKKNLIKTPQLTKTDYQGDGKLFHLALPYPKAEEVPARITEAVERALTLCKEKTQAVEAKPMKRDIKPVITEPADK
ncbi:MAG: hypothetical protein ACKVS6_01895 [Planctomycetota bacterium]